MALRTARTVTPTSAKTAIHMVARPSTASRSTSTLMPIANAMFSLAMRRVRRAMRTAAAILDGLSSMSTTSAASMAASEPSAPMAMPISARVRTGASLMPSPTKASVPSGSRRSTCSTFCAGKRPAWNSLTPSCLATEAATLSWSPVSMTVFRTPTACRAARAGAESALMRSLITIWPA